VGEPQTFAQKVGLTRGKAILVGVLAIALVAVVYRQYGSLGDGESIEAAAGATELQPTATTSGQALPVAQAAAEVLASTDGLATTADFDETKWKPPELATVVAYDPFSLPAAFPRPSRTVEAELAAEGDGESAENADEAAAQLADAIEALQMELAALQARGVNVIVRGPNDYVAMIGDRTVHVGDDIDGFTITAIEPDGVRVERKIQQ
jgi:hypothetical protein